MIAIPLLLCLLIISYSATAEGGEEGDDIWDDEQIPNPQPGSVVVVPQPESHGHCSIWTECFTCTDNLRCVWCEKEQICVEGTIFGTTCEDDWKYGQCQVKGLYVALGCVSTLAVILFIGIILIYFCCKRNSPVDFRRKSSPEEMEPFVGGLRGSLLEEGGSGRSVTKKRLDLYEKYGRRDSIKQ